MIKDFKDRSLQGLGRLSSSVVSLVTVGCTDSAALNFNPNAITDDGSCIAVVNGCMDPLAGNFNSLANVDNGCEYAGCMDPAYIEYDLQANVNTNATSCITLIVNGCTDISTFTVDGISYQLFINSGSLFNTPCDGTGGSIPCVPDINGIIQTGPNCCCVSTVLGCTDPTAVNYNPAANMNYDSLSGNSGICSFDFTGCTDPTATNYNASATIDDGSCVIPIYGCMGDPFLYYNYNSSATIDDGSCEIFIYGCTDPNSFNYDPNANTNATGPGGLTDPCVPFIYGCLADVNAFNYNCASGNAGPNCSDNVNTDDGSCNSVALGCTDPSAFNYNASANIDDGSCIPIIYGCIDPTAFNYNVFQIPSPNTDDGSCVAAIIGCTDPSAANFDPNANSSGGTILNLNPNCLYNAGCMDASFVEYDPNADFDDGSYCITPAIYGCTDSTQFNYDLNANIDNGTCVAIALGCIDPTQFNYDVNANTDDGSCVAIAVGCTDPSYLEYNPNANTDDGSCLTFVSAGCTDSGLTNDLSQIAAINYNPLATTDDGSCQYIMPTLHTNTLTSGGSPSKPALNGSWTLNPQNNYSNIRAVWNVAKSPKIIKNGTGGTTINFFNPTFVGNSNQTHDVNASHWQFSTKDPNATAAEPQTWRSSNLFIPALHPSLDFDINGNPATPLTLLRYDRYSSGRVYFKGTAPGIPNYSYTNVDGQIYRHTLVFKFENPNIPDISLNAEYTVNVGCPETYTLNGVQLSNCSGVQTGSVFISPGDPEEGNLAFENITSCADGAEGNCLGCTDSTASNYDSTATQDDGSCN